MFINPKKPYFWSISEFRNDEIYGCVEDSATSADASAKSFKNPDDAFEDGLYNLKNYTTGDYCLELYYFTPDGAGEYLSGYYATVSNGKLSVL